MSKLDMFTLRKKPTQQNSYPFVFCYSYNAFYAPVSKDQGQVVLLSVMGLFVCRNLT